MPRGRFITLEGGEGSGKSTLLSGLCEAVRDAGFMCIKTREPGGTPLAESVRELALNPPGEDGWSPLAHALLMNTARQDHLERKIRPALKRGDWVLCDRFADSTRAYQSVDGVSIKTLKTLEQAVIGDTVPDLTLILDADPEMLLSRRDARGVTDTFEARGADFHAAIRAAFLQIAKDEPERCVVINAAQSPEEVLAQALQVIRARFIIDA